MGWKWSRIALETLALLQKGYLSMMSSMETFSRVIDYVLFVKMFTFYLFSIRVVRILSLFTNIT